jgi:ribosomal protein S18 acetylase RimI-like enzyme
MPILQASPAHLTDVRRLLHDTPYTYLDTGTEDLPHLLAAGYSAVGLEASRIWGFLCLQLEERPTTLPPAAPARAYTRAVAVQQLLRPGHALRELLTVVDQQLRTSPQSAQAGVQILCYGADGWLASALVEAGFTEVEQVQFFQLDRLSRRVAALPSPPSDLRLESPGPTHLEELARLDAAAFPPLWHFGTKDLLELIMRCRVRLAWREGRLVGYSAVCANSRSEAQLARLAVHPALQGQGIGRTLLADSIVYAAEEYAILVLNTQTSNTRSQKLYKGFGFRPMGLSIPVLARTVK